MTAHIMLSMDEWVEHLQQQATIAKQREVIGFMLSVVRGIEYSEIRDHQERCISCFEFRHIGHRRICPIAAAIRKAEEVLK